MKNHPTHGFAARAVFAGGLLAMALVACGGGGGGSSAVPSAGATGGSTASPTATPTPSVSPSPSPSPTVVPQSVTGKVVEFTSGAALAGFTVTVGTFPNAATCNAAQTQTLNVCGAPASIAATVTTASDGTFSVPAISAGTYMLTIGKDSTYATLHRSVTVAASQTNALGTIKVAALSSDEQAWLVDVNHLRATVSVPVSFANLQIDEYAEEQSRAEAAAIASGVQPFSDATALLYSGYYAASPGAIAIYGAAAVSAEQGVGSTYLGADAAWFGAKSNCPNGNWQNCPGSVDANGPYITLSNTQNVWIGLGESSSTPAGGSPFSVYTALIPINVGSSGPASIHRSR